MGTFEFKPLNWESLERSLPLLLLLLAFNLAVNVIALLFAYNTKNPRVFQKTSDGRVPFFSWVIFWPYFAYMRLLLLAWNRISREPAFMEAVPGLYLGRRLGWGDEPLAAALEPLAVLDLAAELAEPEFMREQGAYLSLPVLDTTAPTPRQMDRALAFLREHLGQRPVYVHCALGHGRGATVVAVYLLLEKRFATLEEAVAFLRATRYGVRLNRRQKKAARRYLEKCAGRTRPTPEQQGGPEP